MREAIWLLHRLKPTTVDIWWICPTNYKVQQNGCAKLLGATAEILISYAFPMKASSKNVKKQTHHLFDPCVLFVSPGVSKFAIFWKFKGRELAQAILIHYLPIALNSCSKIWFNHSSKYYYFPESANLSCWRFCYRFTHDKLGICQSYINFSCDSQKAVIGKPILRWISEMRHMPWEADFPLTVDTNKLFWLLKFSSIFLKLRLL